MKKSHKVVFGMLVILLIGLGSLIYYYVDRYNYPLPLKRDFTFSYYNPIDGTKKITSGVPPPRYLTLIGKSLEKPIIVYSDLGRNVVSITKNGKLNWLKLSKSHRGIAYSNGSLYYPHRNKIIVLDSLTGEKINELGGFNHTINSLNIVDDFLILTFSTAATQSVVLYKLENNGKTIKLAYENPHKASYSRYADLKDNILFIADTFGHRVYGVNIDNDKIIFEKKVYFPNDVKVTPEGTLLIAEEHANRITQYDYKNNDYKVVFSCPDSIYSDPSLKIEEIIRLSKQKIKNDKSICAEETAGLQTLYSPNGVTYFDKDSFWVADTDNHRVVFIQGGRIISAVYGFNNPVKIAISNQ